MVKRSEGKIQPTLKALKRRVERAEKFLELPGPTKPIIAREYGLILEALVQLSDITGIPIQSPLWPVKNEERKDE